MAEIPSTELSNIKNHLTSLDYNIQSVSRQVADMYGKSDTMFREIQKLQQDFQRLVVDQHRSSALQQAATELVTIRQEISRKFGIYDNVRRTMTGILQATDAAIVKKTTISQVSEELMLSAPDYWLAPVLVAISAWISNDRDLADRAIREALKRDTEHTSLVMALVCRRNNRIDTCYEWLAKYFSTQDSASFDEDSMVYIDAYVNGIFGPDKKHMCDDYISNWLDEIKGGSSDFEQEQAETWEQYFAGYIKEQTNQYPGLKNYSKEFGYINDYLERIDAAPAITRNFAEINDAEVDQEVLRKEVDKHLVRLVNSDDKSERELREKEEYFIAVKALNGDTQAAREMINKRRQDEKDKTMNLVDQMTRTISTNKKATFSEKKTACTFLSGFINKGYSLFINEKKETFPQNINITVDGWNGTVPREANDGTRQQLINEYNNYLKPQYDGEIAQATKANNPKPMFYSALVFVILGAILCFAIWPLGIISLVVAGILGIMGLKKKKNLEPTIKQITDKYNARAQQGANSINGIVNEWQDVNNKVANFETHKIEQIVA